MQEKIKSAWSVACETMTEDVARAIALIVVVASIAYLAINGKPIPVEILTIASLILGFYFGRGVTNGKD